MLVIELAELFREKYKSKKASKKLSKSELSDRPFVPHWLLRLGVFVCLFYAFFAAWREEHGKVQSFNLQRPNFSEENSGIEYPPSQNNPTQVGRPLIVLKFQNKGQHAATTLSGHVYIMDISLATPPITVTKMEGTGIYEPGVPMNYPISIETLPANSSPVLIYIGFEYDDAFTGRKFRQSFERQWRGTTNGEGLLNFVGVSFDDKKRIREYLKKRGLQIYE